MTLLELLQLLRKHLRLVIALPLVCALAMGVASFMFLPNTYTATTSMYVLVKGDSKSSSMSTDLSASQMVTNDVAQLIDSDRVTKDTANEDEEPGRLQNQRYEPNHHARYFGFGNGRRCPELRHYCQPARERRFRCGARSHGRAKRERYRRS